MTKFFKYGDRDRKAQKFNKEEITITKAGKTYNVYDAIQAANVDTNIYDVMKKYNCTEDAAVQLMQERGGEKGVYGNIVKLQQQIQDIGDVQRVAEQAKTMFEQLPVEVKQKYGNNLADFFKAQKEKAEKAAQENQHQQTNTEQGVNNNETK